jgi:hypothetical protein
MAGRAIAAFRDTLRNSVRTERERGRLRPITPASELERCAVMYRTCAWGAAERDALIEMIPPGVRI